MELILNKLIFKKMSDAGSDGSEEVEERDDKEMYDDEENEQIISEMRKMVRLSFNF